jgi:uncharacterized protein
MNIYSYHVFKHKEKYFLFHIEMMTIISIKRYEADLLILVSKNPNKLDKKVENLLFSLSLINTKDKIQKISSQNPLPITNIALFVTQDCNLSCIYCYGNQGSYGTGGEMNKKVAYKSIDWLIEKSKDQKRLTVSFFGGEPLLNINLIKNVIEYSLKKGKKLNKNFEFNINTNATKLDKETIAFFVKCKMKVLVSLDGPKEIQDYQRPFKNGRGSYTVILPKIKELVLSLPDTTCRAVLLDNTKPTLIENTLHGLGFKNISISYKSLSLFDKKERNQKEERNFSQIFKKIKAEAVELTLAIKEKDIEKLMKLKESGIIYSRFNKLINGQKKIFPCGAGRSSVAISCKGEIFLCHRFVGINNFKIGDISNEKLDRIKYQTSPLDINQDCKNCYAKYLCAGGCYHDNFGYMGSLTTPSSDMCKLMKYMVTHLLIIFIQLNENDLNYLYMNNIIEKKICPFDF